MIEGLTRLFHEHVGDEDLSAVAFGHVELLLALRPEGDVRDGPARIGANPGHRFAVNVEQPYAPDADMGDGEAAPVIDRQAVRSRSTGQADECADLVRHAGAHHR